MSYAEYLKRVITVFAVGIFLLGVWHLKTILLLAFLAGIIAVSLEIPVRRLRRFGFHRSTSIFLTLFLVLTTIGLFMAWVLPATALQMSSLVANFPDAYEDVRDTYLEWRSEQSPTFQNALPELDNAQLEEGISQLTAIASPIVRGAGNTLLSALTNFFVLVIISVFLLIDPHNYIHGFIVMIPASYRDRALQILVELRLTVTTWMTAITFSISITVFLVWLVLGVFLSVPNALALGVIAGVMTIIPTIGAVVPLIPIAIFTLADDPSKLPIVIPAYLLIQFTESYILTPSIVRRELNIPAALILLFQLIAGTLFGFFGVLLAVPMLAVIITLIRELYIYDVLGMRDSSISVIELESGDVRLITRESAGERSLVKDTISIVAQIRGTGTMPRVRNEEEE